MEKQTIFKVETPEETAEKAKILTTKAKSLLMHRYEQPEWALFFEVMGETNHIADAIAINMYHSRGHRILGFEIKASRNDWLNELKNGAKADYFFKHVDEWYIIEAREGIVKLQELPPNWGLISARGERLFTRAKSDLGIKSPNREFFVRMLQKAYSQYKPQDLVWEAERRGRELGRKDALSNDYISRDFKEKAMIVDKLQEAGLSLWHYSPEQIEDIKMAIKVIEKIRDDWGIKGYLEDIGRNVDKINNERKICLDLIDKLMKAEELEKVRGAGK